MKSTPVERNITKHDDKWHKVNTYTSVFEVFVRFGEFRIVFPLRFLRQTESTFRGKKFTGIGVGGWFWADKRKQKIFENRCERHSGGTAADQTYFDEHVLGFGTASEPGQVRNIIPVSRALMTIRPRVQVRYYSTSVITVHNRSFYVRLPRG